MYESYIVKHEPVEVKSSPTLQNASSSSLAPASMPSVTTSPPSSLTISSCPSTASPKKDPHSPVALSFMSISNPDCKLESPCYMVTDPIPSDNSPYHKHQKQDDCPPVKKRKVLVDEMLSSLKSMEPTAQFELWRRMLSTHPFNLEQLKTLRTAIDERIKVDIISGVPYEIASYIMSFLSPRDLCHAGQTCRSWRVVCEDNRLWREKCIEEGLLSDGQILSVLMEKRIAQRNKVQEKFVSNYTSANVPRLQWKSAYLQHINILRNWQRRGFEIKDPLIASPQQSQSQSPAEQVETVQVKLEVPDQEDTQSEESDQLSPRYSGNIQQVGGERQRLIELRGHEESVITCLQYNPQSNIIVSGSDDTTLKVWCTETGRCLTTLQGHTGGVWASQLSPDDIVISGATDRTLKVWRAHTGELIHTLYGHGSTVRCLALNDDKVVSGSRDTTLRLWDINQGTCLNVFTGHSAAVRCVEFKGDRIVSGAYDHLVMVWDATTGSCLHSLECHVSRIYSLQFDGKTIASGSLDSSICIWDAETGELRHKLTGHTSLTSKMQLRGNILVSANADSYCKVWDVKKGTCLRTLGGPNKHKSAITSVYFDRRHVVTSSDDGTVKLWNINTGEFIRNLIVLPTADEGGVVWRIRASYTKLIVAVGSRSQVEDTHLLVLDFDD